MHLQVNTWMHASVSHASHMNLQVNTSASKHMDAPVSHEFASKHMDAPVSHATAS